ncbi:16S rRNA (guanine(966)-N(2))-methyltransferase RsmD [Williamsoniiplasma lucivorax]|uniref:16S rRNA (Guanine966-N2)-methyltransferase n=1 Tax=Williamsoniiplasma lucivorax TaxID=209274 RepID=A0A2S5RFP9_9MOLU|nr:16S rRNA (guanine(966)-N(2))-methyltransferase RsmD [Williamsoniiplasma lucivorax]PPE06159.1 16S rRNA (guanine966-N2)-methyltransferase [Williamsoniiplasma lucivorax]
MIVISGKYKGKKLKTLAGMNTRPTSARVKEDMFNMLANYFIFENKISLDLFGGSGALSIEGLSRGVKFAYINDHFTPALKVIKQNLRTVEPTSYQLMQLDFEKLLETFKFQQKKVDLIYFDPPFTHPEYYEKFFHQVLADEILNNWGIILTEAPMPLDLTKISSLKLLKYKDFKNKHLYIFRLERQEHA